MTTKNPIRKSSLLHRHLLIPALLTCAMVLSSASTGAQTNTKAAKFYEDALVRFDKKDMPGAIIQLKNALQVDNTLLPVHLLLGKALMQNGEVAAAEVALHEALTLGVSRAEIVVLLGQAYSAQGKLRELLERPTFTPAGLPPGVQLKLHLLRASAYADLGETRNALKSVDEARAIDSRSADVWLAEIAIRVRARQFTEAMAAADKALVLLPDSVEGWYQKGSIQHVQGNMQNALANYDRVLQTDPSHIAARIARIGIYQDVGRYEDAAKDIGELHKTAPNDPRGAYLRALMEERRGDLSASRAALKEVTNLLDPVPFDFIRYQPQILMLNGLAHFGLGEGEKAKQYLEAFQKIQDNSPTSKLLARIYLANGNPAQAMTVLETYLKSQPGDGQALTLLASCHMALGRPAKASALMQEALKAQDNPAFRTALGISMVGAGQASSGIVELEAAYKKDPRQVQAATALVKLYLRSNQARKGVPIAEQLVKLQAGNAEYHNLLGMVQGQSGSISAARASFAKAISLDGNLTAAKLNMARLEIATKAFDPAAKRLTDLLKTASNNGEAMFELAVIADRSGRQPDAQRWLEKARDTAGGRDLRWDLALIEFHLRYGRAGIALDAAKVASGKAPDDLQVLLAYSRAQLAVGDAVSAKSTLTSATRFAEYNAPQQVQIAGLQLAANNPAGAAYSLDKALSGQPGYLPAQAMMVEVELRRGDREKAEKRAREFVAQNPKLAMGHTLLGDVAMAKREPSAAVESYRRAHQTESSTDSVLRLMRALSGQDSGKAAWPLAEQWLKAHPLDLAVHKALADGLARNGNFQSARGAYVAALKLKPDDSEVLNNLANVQLRLRDPEAVKTAEAALANAPGDPLVTDTLGWALFHNGQADRSLQLLREARLRQPGNPEIRFHLATVLARTGRKNEAIDELESAMNLSVEFEGRPEAATLLKSLK